MKNQSGPYSFQPVGMGWIIVCEEELVASFGYGDESDARNWTSKLNQAYLKGKTEPGEKQAQCYE